MNSIDLQQLDELITRRVGAFAEDVLRKLDLIIEGQNVAAHRRDTEAHQVYRVGE